MALEVNRRQQLVARFKAGRGPGSHQVYPTLIVQDAKAREQYTGGNEVRCPDLEVHGLFRPLSTPLSLEAIAPRGSSQGLR